MHISLRRLLSPSTLLVSLALPACVYIDQSTLDARLDLDGDGVPYPTDCAPDDPAVFPGAPEICDGVDQDCDGEVDDDPVDAVAWYLDGDDDGYGDGAAVTACDAPEGRVADATDCNDADGAIYPGAAEVCDGVDQDCDSVDDNDPADAPTWYADLDGDGFGDSDQMIVACENPDDASLYGDDCDDTDEFVYPGALETCDGVDQDCDGTIDNDAADALTWYADIDGDGHGDADAPVYACEQPVDAVELDDDCEDADAEVHPGAAETDCADPKDYNCDGSVGTDDADSDGAIACEDCDDTDGARYPAAVETCDGVDQDCDSVVDDSAVDAGQWYQDTDGDGYGTGVAISACAAPIGYVAITGDCDDAHADALPGGVEVCDGLDNDCDGTVDVGTSDETTWYLDSDRDGFGDDAVAVVACEAPTGYVSDPTDCDDSAAAVYPGAPEVCDDVDNACNGSGDDLTGLWFADVDGDGFGDPTDVSIECAAPAGYVADDTDCDDTDDAINPDADEICDGIDDNCDGVSDTDAIDVTAWYLDSDSDGFGDSGFEMDTCDAPVGYVSAAGDCDDGDPAYHPGAEELDCTDPNDYNCDGSVAAADVDGDGYAACEDCDDGDAGVNPGAAEDPGTGIDEDCDGGELCYNDDDNDGYLDSTGDTIVSTNTSCADSYEGTDTDLTTDCDDADAGDHPGATETVGNQDDEDCNGGETCYDDDDNDGWLDTTADTRVSTDADCADANEAPSTDLTTDCDDADAGDHPGATETVGNQDDEDCNGGEICYNDDDNDAYLDSTGDTIVSANTSCLDSYEGTNTDLTTDCDDADAGDHPGATETVGNQDDEDCNGGEICYDDDDNDGYLDTTADTRVSTDVDCADANEAPSTDPTTDCDDASASAYPGATEIVGDSLDASCDGSELCYNDDDNDGYLDTSGDTIVSSANVSCLDAYEGTNTDPTTDCNDAVATIYPSATESCNDIDDDCDGTADDALPTYTSYRDSDGDSYGDAAVSTFGCSVPAGYVAGGADCDDSDAAVNPGAAEVCNTTDDDCDFEIDEAGASGEPTWYRDADNDGYGSTTSQQACDEPPGYVGDSTDCDDTESGSNPGATEVCEDGMDNDCDEDATDCRSTTVTSVASVVSATAGQTIYGSQANEYFGTAIAGGGDADGDSQPDVIVGADGWDSSAGTNQYGKAYVWYGPLSTTDATTSADAVYAATENGEAVGNSVAFIPDYAGADGKSEILLGAWKRNGSTGTDSGAAYIFAGGSASTTVASALSTITGTTGNEAAGFVVLGGSFDGNVAGDFVVTAPANLSSYPNAGSVNLWYDGIAAGTSSIATAELRITGTSTGDFFGAAASNGDVDGDGVDDLVIGAYGVDSGTSADVGAAYFVFGDGGMGTLAGASADILFTNSTASDRVGYSVAILGDIDGDGYSDIGVGGDRIDSSAETDAGKVFLLDGAGIADGTTTGSVALSSSAAAALEGGNASDYFGKVLSTAGDLDADGYADFVIAAPGYDNGSTNEAGIYYLEYGTSAFTPAVTAGWTMPGAGDGTAVTTVPQPNAIGCLGDLDGDGYDDIGLSSAFTENGTVTNPGGAWFVYGMGI